ncbi:MAG: histidine--tRNA ligase [Nitrososphaeria archaeon]
MKIPRGLRDYDPEVYEKLEKIRENFVTLSRSYNVKLMEPSSLEFLETLEAKGGEEIINEIYAFKDKSGRDLGLRFDLTVGITRYVCERRDIPLPVKLGAFASMWRYDEPQKGRYRWFYQWDLEVYGDKTPESYAEVLSFTYRMLKSSGVKKPIIFISDRRTVEAAIKDIAGEKFSVDLLRAIDKLGKKSEEEIVLEYEEKGYTRDLIRSVLEVSKADENSSVVKKYIEPDLLEVRDLLKALNVPVNINFKIVRGLDYYTDIVFEAYDEGSLDLGAIAGGGGYDSLPVLFGREDLKALGVAGGVDRLLLASQLNQETEPLIYVGYINELKTEAFKITEKLRDAGFRSDLAHKNRLNEQLSEAERNGASLVLLVLPREFSRGILKVKEMKTRQEFEITKEDLVNQINKFLTSSFYQRPRP